MRFASSVDTNGLLSEPKRGSGSNTGRETKTGSVTAQQQLDGVLWAGWEVQAVINIIHHGDRKSFVLLVLLDNWFTVHCAV